MTFYVTTKSLMYIFKLYQLNWELSIVVESLNDNCGTCHWVVKDSFFQTKGLEINIQLSKYVMF